VRSRARETYMLLGRYTSAEGWGGKVDKGRKGASLSTFLSFGEIHAHASEKS